MAGHTAYEPAGTTYVHRRRSRYTVRQWPVRQSRKLETLYRLFAGALLRLHPVWKAIGYGRVEKPMVPIERGLKSFMFDCRMCGHCILSSTGMACPMNCPKGLRNGPCGGVRADGHCEIEPEMPCVWVEAWKGSRTMVQGDLINVVQKPVDHSLRGTSSWLRVTSQAAAEREAANKP
jgi:hypothetical protein